MIYLDNAATTQVSEAVMVAMAPYNYNNFGNASSAYEIGRQARDAIEKARKYVADLINAESEEIYFTSGGSEANNWAIKGTFDYYSTIGYLEDGFDRKYIATSPIEHPSVLATCHHVDYSMGAELSILPIESNGVLNMGDDYCCCGQLELNRTFLISVMFANNEIGTIQPIADIGKMCRDHNILFHTDAVQAFGQIPIDVKAMNIDMLSASGHKIHAPKGIGCLYVRKGVPIYPLIHGGHQEHLKRAGTENVVAIVGFGEAAYQAKRRMKKNAKKVAAVRDIICDRLLNEVPDCHVNGDISNRLPNNLSITFKDIDNESLVLMLDKMGICVSAGSACMTGDVVPSHVLKAIGLTDEQVYGTIRITPSASTTSFEANMAVDAIKKCVEILRTK